MKKPGTYAMGFSLSEVNEDKLRDLDLVYRIVNPREQLVAAAHYAVGKTYKRGASVQKDAPEAFDCSCLAAWAAAEAGFAIPRISIDQYVFSQKINQEDLKVGDYIFTNTKEIIHKDGDYFSQVLGKQVSEEPIRFETLEYMPGTKVPEGIDHVGIYVGEGKVIHSSSKKGGVVEENISESDSFQNELRYGRIVTNEEKRYVIEIPADRPDLRSKEALLKELM